MCEIFKNSLFYRTPLLATFVQLKRKKKFGRFSVQKPVEFIHNFAYKNFAVFFNISYRKSS